MRAAVAAKIEAMYGHSYDAASEITITAGATQAIITAILAVVRPGDEVIVLEPCYDSYVPNIELAGGTVVRVPLTPGSFRPDFDKIAAAINGKTRALLINSPHNPSATVWSSQDMLRLQELLAPDRRAADQRRGLRAHGVRRPGTPERGPLSRAWRRAPSSSPVSARPIT